MTETERQTIINWLSDKVVSAYRRESALRAEPGVPSNGEWLDKLDAARADIKRWSDLRLGAATGDDTALDRARSARLDEEDGAAR
ncbi:MAG TPA: hypothetical protein VIN70_02130 [Candidatus Limnocylindria bacterium]